LPRASHELIVENRKAFCWLFVFTMYEHAAAPVISMDAWLLRKAGAGAAVTEDVSSTSSLDGVANPLQTHAI